MYIPHQDKPLEKDKGLYMGACNRRACQERPANWFNPNMGYTQNIEAPVHYCENCAVEINLVNKRMEYWKPLVEVNYEGERADETRKLAS